jgi:HEAT repeat protein
VKWQIIAISCLLFGGCKEASVPVTSGKPISYWVKATTDADPKARRDAVFKLGNTGSADVSVMPALIAALKDPDSHVRCEAILAIMKTKSPPDNAVASLKDMQTHDSDAKVRDYAAKACKKIQSPGS